MLFDMNILHLSDTHGAHRSLGSIPEADVIVHSGDIARVKHYDPTMTI